MYYVCLEALVRQTPWSARDPLVALWSPAEIQFGYGHAALWDPIIKALAASFGIAVVLGLWYALQMYLRYRSGCGKDRDLLEFMAHGCAGCKGPGSCGRNPEHTETEEHHHELV